MVAAVVEGAVGDEDVGGRGALLVATLLGAEHDEGELPRRLPDLFLLDDFLGVGGPVLGAVVVAGLGVLDVVDPVAVVVGAAVQGVVLVVAFGDGAVGHDVEARLRLGDQVPVLVLLQADVLLLQLLLRGLVALVHRLRVHPHVVREPLRGHHVPHALLALAADVHLGGAVELARLLRVLAGVGGRVVEVVGVLLAVVGDGLGVLVARGPALQLALVADVVVGGELAHEIFLADAVEVGVLEGVDGGESLGGVHAQELLHEVDGPGRGLAEVPLVDGVEGVDVGELHAEEALVLEEGLVVVGRERAEALLDEEELIELVLAGEHGVAVDELAENATDCPHVDLLPVGRPHQQFGRPVPPRGHVVSELFLCAPPALPREPEVADLEFLLVADEQVFRFDVAVEHVEGVHVGEALEELVEEEADAFGVEAVGRLLEDFEEVVLDVLEDEVDDALLAEGLLELDDVGVLQHLEDLHLPHRGLAHDLVLLRLLELLYRHHLLVIVAPALQHHSVRALPDHPQDVVLLHQNQQQNQTISHSNTRTENRG